MVGFIKKGGLEVSLVLAFCFVYVVYAVFALHSNPADQKWLFDVIEGLHQHSIDDAYRFFETRAAWHNADLWSWAYLLPLDAAFKGLLHSLTDSDIFWMRVGQFTVNLVGVYALYASCLLLGVRKILAFLICISLMLMPLFMVVSMSFYGESLLGAMLAWAMYFHLSGRRTPFMLTAGLMPLVQLQGLFLISGYFLHFARLKQWRSFFLLALPGFVYFINVMMVHRGVLDFLSFTQLHKLYPALPVPIQERGWMGGLETFNLLLVLLSIAGAALVWKRVWPVYTGIALWFFQVSTAMTYTNGYEPRYLFPCLPAIFLTLSCCLDYLSRRFNSRKGGTGNGLFPVILVLLALTLENFGQSDPIRENYFGGRRWPIGEPHVGVNLFVSVQSRSEFNGQDLARRIEAFLSENREFKLLMVNQHEIFYFLDRIRMPEDVRIAYTPFPPALAYPAFLGKFFALSPSKPQAEFYEFFKEEYSGQGKALFVADFEPLGWRPNYKNQHYSVYQVGYKISEPPEKIFIIHRMSGVASDPSHYKGKNLCPSQDGHVCPDWRKGVFFGFD